VNDVVKPAADDGQRQDDQEGVADVGRVVATLRRLALADPR
jgi:hypothetical protein